MTVQIAKIATKCSFALCFGAKQLLVNISNHLFNALHIGSWGNTEMLPINIVTVTIAAIGIRGAFLSVFPQPLLTQTIILSCSKEDFLNNLAVGLVDGEGRLFIEL